MNVHIRSDLNKNVLYGIVQDLEIDILSISETWFEYGKSSIEMKKTFGKDFYWFGKERKKQRSYCGSGGIGILARASIGKFSLEKVSQQFEILWVKLDLDKVKYFIGTVYIPPDGSIYAGDMRQILLELESDILEFRKHGKVILMGDFNSRILTHPSTINVNGEFVSFKRQTKDTECKDQEALNRGTQLISTMNTANMIIMNGLDGIGEATFEVTSQKKSSIIDYIMLSDNIIIPGNEINLLDKSINWKSTTINSYSMDIPENTEYYIKFDESLF